MAIDPQPPGQNHQSIRIQLRALPDLENPEAQREQLLTMVAAVLLVMQNNLSLACAVETVSDIQLIYDVIPLPDQVLPAESLTAILEKLRTHPAIASATLHYAALEREYPNDSIGK